MIANKRDPFARGLIKNFPFTKACSIEFSIVAVLDHYIENRDLHIMNTLSRSISRYSIPEIIVTEEDVKLGGAVNSVAYIGFVAAKNCGQATVGRKVLIQRKYLGYIAGFDETHAPNHLP